MKWKEWNNLWAVTSYREALLLAEHPSKVTEWPSHDCISDIQQKKYAESASVSHH